MINKLLMSFECDLCMKLLTRKSTLYKHRNNASCKSRQQRTCPVCNKVFNSIRNAKNHMDKVDCKSYNPVTIDKDLEISKLREQVEHLKSTQHVTNNNNNNIIIFPEAFGTENIEHICKKLGVNILKDAALLNRGAIPYLVEQIHCNKALPEYNNMFMSDEKTDFINVSDGERFLYRPKAVILNKIINDNRIRIGDYVQDNADSLGRKIINTHDRYIHLLDTDDKALHSLELEIIGLLLGMKDIINLKDTDRTALERLKDTL
jgi:hypothetical protein